MDYSNLEQVKPDTTVLMVVHNEEETIEATIKSILGQTYKNFKFLIIDDGSSDQTLKIVRSINDQRIEVVHFKERAYLTSRLNYGLRKIKTNFVARMDAHNVADKFRLEKQRSFLLKNHRVVLVGSNYQRINKDGKILYKSNFPLRWDQIKNEIMGKNLFKHASWFARVKTLKIEACYNENWRFSQDYEFLLRIIAKYPVANLPDYFLTETQLAKSTSQAQRFSQAVFVLRAQIKSYHNYPRWQIIYLFRTLGYIINSLIWQRLHVSTFS